MRPVDPALLRALPATRGPVASLSVVGILSGVVAIAQALTLALVVGAAVRGSREELTAYLGWLVALLVLRGVLAGTGELVARRAGLRVVGIVREALLRHWLGRPVEARPRTEVAVTRATDGVSALEPYVARYLPALVTAAVVPALALVALVVVDPWSALIVVLTLPLLPLFAALIGMHTRDETQRRWGAMDLLAGHFLDVMKGLPTLVAYGRARAQVEVVREVGERHRRASVATLRTAFLSTAALELLATISVAMVAVAVGLRLAHGGMDLVVGLSAILLAPEAYWPIRRVGAEFHNAADGAQVLEELADEGVLGGAAAQGPGGRADGRAPRPGAATSGESAARGARPATPAGGSIGLTEVSYAHPGRVRTLAELSLRTPSGPGVTALTGPSGAGKTTVLELLAGLRIPATGTVSAPAAHLATQRPLLLPGTVRDNLAIADPDATDAAMTDALERVGLWRQLADRHGLDTWLGDDGVGLSAGQRARLALARATLSPAPLLLLDEPTANVAVDGLPRLHQVITELAETRRIVVVTHDCYLAALADDRWRLEAGGGEPVSLAGGPGDLRAAPDRLLPDRGTDAGPEADPAAHPAADPAAHPVPRPGEVAPVRTPRGRRGLALACLLGGASVGCGVALTATSGWLIVQASTMPVVLTLLVAIVGVRAFGIFRPVFRYAERVVSHDVALDDLSRRRADLYAALIPLTPARLGRRSRGRVLTAAARDLEDVVDEHVRVNVPGWSAGIATLVGAAVAGWHLPAAGVVVAAGGLVVAAVALLGYAAERPAQDAAVARRGEVREQATALAAQLLPVQAVSGVAGGHRQLLDPVLRAEEAHRRGEARLTRARAAALAATWVVVAATATTVALLAFDARAVGALSGPFAALVALVPLALADAWAGVPDIAGARARARSARARLDALVDQTPAVVSCGTTAAPTGPPALELREVTARWSPGATGRPTPDLPPLDLDVQPGDRIRLDGPNGAGKSTALAVLARHLDPEEGCYLVSGADTGGGCRCGADVRTLDLEETRALVAVVDDEPHAFAGSVRANLVLASPGATDGEVLDALGAVDLGGWFATLPQGLDTPLTGLSGGERSRLALARALLSGRPVVLLDEPTAHLDDATAERSLGGLLAGLGGGRSVVLVSHTAPVTGRWTDHRVGRDAPSAADDRAVPQHIG
ncbi:thiol reductant ABC exporter subunit CydD [uncultured Serinicoccus sp.]|uniref:thiol reductant ABC exporter subunit CydD n=1 Tax=uncultured Serinicoccus sp. TaxID=735514 RepID=UPI0026232568|nr:thiol reductant ABC exporter subunit CydD [uncultured Serinicoccus sp.]